MATWRPSGSRPERLSGAVTRLAHRSAGARPARLRRRAVPPVHRQARRYDGCPQGSRCRACSRPRCAPFEGLRRSGRERAGVGEGPAKPPNRGRIRPGMPASRPATGRRRRQPGDRSRSSASTSMRPDEEGLAVLALAVVDAARTRSSGRGRRGARARTRARPAAPRWTLHLRSGSSPCARAPRGG